MKSLGGVILPDQMEWIDRYNWSPVMQQELRTLSGRQVIFSAPLLGGRPITLTAYEQSAWLTLFMVNDLRLLAAQPGAVHELVWEDETISVIFRHHEPEALSFSPLYLGADIFTGIVKLSGA